MNLTDHLPALIIALPLLTAFLMPLLRNVDQRVKGMLAVIVAVVTLLMVISLAGDVNSSEGHRVDYTFGEQGDDGPGVLQNSTALVESGDFPIRILFQIDAFSAFMAIISATVLLVGTLYSLAAVRNEDDARKSHYYALMMLMAVGMFGMEFTGDLFNLFVFMELTSVSACAMVAFHRERGEALEAAFKYLVISTVGGLMMLLGVALFYVQYDALNIRYIAELMANRGVGDLERAALVLFMTCFAMKAGAVPMHMWTLDAYMEAPNSVMPMMVSVSQASLYAVFRIVFTLYGKAYNPVTGVALDHEVVGQALIIFGVLSMFIGVTMALVQSDIKRLMAYCAVSQTGYMFLGVGVGLAVMGTPDFQEYGSRAMAGGIFHIINDALYMGLLFLTAGAVYHKLRTRDLDRMGGLAHTMPFTTIFFIIGAAAIVGLPPFNGYASKVLIFETVYQYNPLLTVIALVVSLLTLAAFVKVFYSAFLGPRNPRVDNEVPKPMLMGMTILAVLVLLLGLAPGLFVSTVVDPTVVALAGEGAFEGDLEIDETLATGTGFWNPLLMLAGLALMLIVILALRWIGEPDVTATGRQGEPFVSGNPNEEIMRVSGVYWGFTEALHGYYEKLRLMHSGDLRDYLFWYISVTALLMLYLLEVAA